MKSLTLALTLTGLASAVQRWEIVPLTDEAYQSFDPQTFDIHNCSRALYNVTLLPDIANLVVTSSSSSDYNTNLDVTQDDHDEECKRIGEPGLQRDWCLPTHDESKCNVAYYVPKTPVENGPPNAKTSIDTFIYDNKCQRLRGCGLNHSKENKWWSTYSDLRWTLESLDRINYP
ncbi:hypothetical protein DL546_005545 [Coniochaeta pulveracea]|nr:hypothetical protein DL546_005545 [Coniochaeta pulveracea]